MSLSSAANNSPSIPPQTPLPQQTPEEISIARLPARAQARILQKVFHKQTPRELRSLLGRHIVELVVPKACQDGMAVSEEEQAKGSQIIEEYAKRICREVIPRFFQKAEIGEQEKNAYLDRFTSEGARADREALLHFFTDAVITCLPLLASNRGAIQSSIVANETLEHALRDFHKAAPRNLHNILLMYHPQRIQLTTDIDAFFTQQLPALSKLQLTILAQWLFTDVAPEEEDGVVSGLALQWADLLSRAGTSTAREMKDKLKEYLKSQEITSYLPQVQKEAESKSAAVKKTSEPAPIQEALTIGKVLSRIMTMTVLPSLLPNIVQTAKILFGAIPASDINLPERWDAKIPKMPLLDVSKEAVAAYLSKFRSPELEEKKAILAFLTDYLCTFLPTFFPPLKMQPALIPYLLPIIQGQIVLCLEQDILPIVQTSCPRAFHNLIASAQDPSIKTIMDSFSEFQVELSKLSPAERQECTACLQGKASTSQNPAIAELIEKWAMIESQDKEGTFKKALESDFQLVA
jgi:hypothetical protein